MRKAIIPSITLKAPLRTDSGHGPPAPDSDEALIAQIAARNEAAFRVLGERYGGLVFSIAYRMLNRRDAAEDVVQDVLLRLWLHAGDWNRARGASVKTWLCRITSNACIDIQRRRREIQADEIPERPDPSAGAEEALAGRETGAIVARALQTLPERQRFAIVMFHYEGLSVAEIGAALAVSPKAAEGLLTRGRIALRDSLEHAREDIG